MKKRMKHFLLLTVIPVFFISPAAAQNIKLEWFKHFGSANENAQATSIIIDSNKSVLVCGSFRGTVDFDGGPGVANFSSNGDQDFFITKYDTAGNFIWARTIGGTQGDDAKAIRVDSHGNIYVIGLIQSTVDMDPGPGVFNITTNGSNSYLLKLDANGSFLDAKQFQVGSMTTLTLDGNDNILLGGYFGGTVDFDPGPGIFSATTNLPLDDDFFVVKLDNAANFLWMRQFKNQGGGTLQSFSACTDYQNSIYFTGNFTSGMDFNPGTGTAILTGQGTDDTFICKLDAQGNFIWVKQFGSPAIEKISSIKTDANGNVYSTGEFYGPLDFDPGPGSYPLTSSTGLRSCFISKLDINGNFIYAKNLQSGVTFGESLAIDIADNVYVAGGFYNLADLDPGPAVFNVDYGNRFILKLDPTGNFLWGAGFITQIVGSFESIYSDLVVDALKNVYYAGSFPFAIDWDPSATNSTFTPEGNSDAYFLKLSQCNNSLHVIAAQTCTGYTLNGTTYFNSGTYYQTLPNSVGCDSIIQLYLSIGNITQQLDVSTCDSYLFNGNQLTSSGTYTATIHLSNGCDSIVQLNLTITSIQTEQTAVSCNSYSWNGTTYATSGDYTHVYTLPGGCDSTVQLHLTINNTVPPVLGNDALLCDGDSLLLNAGTYNSYQWSDGSMAATISIHAPGNYWVTVTGSNGCTASDSIKVTPSANCNKDCVLTAETTFLPNPFSNYVVINKNATDCEVKLNVYNSIGQLVIKGRVINNGANTLSFGNLAKGVYFFKFYTGNKILLTKKLVNR